MEIQNIDEELTLHGGAVVRCSCIARDRWAGTAGRTIRYGRRRNNARERNQMGASKAWPGDECHVGRSEDWAIRALQ